MKISLVGYMGSGKSTVGRALAQSLELPFIDLDAEIEQRQKSKIPELFEQMGIIGFRKIEHEVLSDLLERNENFVLATGGGTPVYYDNIDLLNEKTHTFYLQNSIKILTERLMPNKSGRPLIAHLSDTQLPEFIAKHLFERENFYRRAKYILHANAKSEDELVNDIIRQLQDQNHL